MAEWGTSLFGWGSILVVLVAMGINVSFFLGADWTKGITVFVSGWIRALSIPTEFVPSVILLCIFVAFIFYNIGYYKCFFEEDPDEVAAEQEHPGFVGKHYVGKPGETIQMVIACRGDLEMSTGKTALQCGHATVGIYRRVWQKNRGLIKSWEDSGQPKVALSVPSETALLGVQSQAKAKGLPTHVVRDKRSELQRWVLGKRDVEVVTVQSGGAAQVGSELQLGKRTAVVVLGPPSVLESVVGDLPLLQ